VVCAGWGASTFVAGAHAADEVPSRWAAIIDAGRAFHRASATLARPAFLDRATNWWAIADQVAWDERQVPIVAELGDVVRRLRTALSPLGNSQVVHGDLTGNVLFDPALPPAIIDISTYWRPAAYAEGVVIADALTWHDAPASLATELAVPVEAVARALVFRVLTSQLRAAVLADSLEDEAWRYDRAATALNL
jgi:hypothetical protein